MKQWLPDILVSAVISAAMGAIVFGAISGLSVAAAVLLGFSDLAWVIFAIPLLAPAFFIFKGIGSGRPGLIAGPILLVALPAVILYSIGWYQAMEVRAMEIHKFAKPIAEHQIVVMPGYNDRCDDICLRLLTETKYSVAMWNQQSPKQGLTRLFRLAHGDDCFKSQNLESLLIFADSGFTGQCADTQENPVVTDALVIDVVPSDSDRMTIDLPSEYRGGFYEFRERLGGRDRLLGRWISGSVPVLADHWISARFSDIDFYEAALGVKLSREPFVPKDDIPTRVTQLKPMLSVADASLEVLQNYVDLIRRLSVIDPDAANAIILEMMHSEKPRAHTASVYLWPLLEKSHPGVLQEAVLLDLASTDIELLVRVVGMLAQLPAEKRDFAAQELGHVAVEGIDLKRQFGFYYALSDALKDTIGAFAPGDQEKARKILAGKQNISDARRQALEIVASRMANAIPQ